ncbi:MAG: hypothetical protein HUK02_04520 [Bacteroidaceae bacterium]|nr:hypothetical protein [Bacteroidaceae bacterium]
MELEYDQHKALDKHWNIIDIETIKNTSHYEKHKYLCPVCYKEVHLAQGNDNKWRILHNDNNCISSTPEIYLEKVGKQMICDWLIKSNDLKLSLPIKCPHAEKCCLKKNCERKSEPFLLKRKFIGKEGLDPKTVELSDLEFSIDDPQIEHIAIKISVLGKDLGFFDNSEKKIIEFKIEKDDDFDKICQQSCIEENEFTKIHFCDKRDDFQVNVGEFILHKSGKNFVPRPETPSIKCSEIGKERKGLCQIYFPECYRKHPSIRQWGNVKALEHGVQFKNCFICHFCRRDDSNEQICHRHQNHESSLKCSKINANTCPNFQQETPEQLFKNYRNPLNIEPFYFIDNTKTD